MKSTFRRFAMFYILVIAVSICAVILVKTDNVYAVDDYPEEYKTPALDAVVDRWNFRNRECTSFVAWCLNSRNGVEFTNQYGGVSRWGDAKNWGPTAESLGILVDDNPKPGAVAWTNSGYYGHVAWVASVAGNDVSIEEYNYLSPVYNERTVAKSEFRYIHIKDLCSEHKWDNGVITKEAKHTKKELVNGEKVYTCTVCGEIKTEVIKVSHKYRSAGTTKATLKRNGVIRKKCKTCGKINSTIIYRPKTFKLSKTKYKYNGKARKPKVTVKDSKGKKIDKKYYSVSYSSNKKAGTAKVKIKFKGRYSGTKVLKFRITSNTITSTVYDEVIKKGNNIYCTD